MALLRMYIFGSARQRTAATRSGRCSGPQPRHHRVDRELLDRGDAEAWLERRDHVGRAATGRPEQRVHGALGRRYEREPVGPATREEVGLHPPPRVEEVIAVVTEPLVE